METENTDQTLWPNQQPVVDGVTPTYIIDQSPTLFDDVSDEELENQS